MLEKTMIRAISADELESLARQANPKPAARPFSDYPHWRLHLKTKVTAMKKGMSNLASVATVILTLIVAGQLPAQTTWNLTNDFSITNGNPNGAWTYGYVQNSVFQPSTALQNGATGWVCGSPVSGDIWKNTTSVVSYGDPPGQISMQPVNGGASVVRWTAPAGLTSVVQVNGQFLPGDIGIMTVGVFVDGIPGVTSPAWQSTDSGTFDLSVPVSAGNTIDFAVYGGYSYGNTPVQATITSTSVPTWNVNTGGSWHTPGNWSTNTVPNGVGQSAVLGPAATIPSTVTLDSAQTVGTLMFADTAGYTLAAATRVA